ncbi:hypothetical protein ACJIZ3_016249 [Penstemon smallii]|uniref:Uncharacterized protein n=1 Tax=Penstemon smallii TaxID=265156 RepID=A0ABD3RT34_9LAMI
MKGDSSPVIGSDPITTAAAPSPNRAAPTRSYGRDLFGGCEEDSASWIIFGDVFGDSEASDAAIAAEEVEHYATDVVSEAEFRGEVEIAPGEADFARGDVDNVSYVCDWKFNQILILSFSTYCTSDTSVHLFEWGFKYESPHFGG